MLACGLWFPSSAIARFEAGTRARTAVFRARAPGTVTGALLVIVVNEPRQKQGFACRWSLQQEADNADGGAGPCFVVAEPGKAVTESGSAADVNGHRVG